MMHSARIGQAVLILAILVIAASCAATKEYTSKLFTPRIPAAKDSQVVALKFLDVDSTEKDNANWVSTDFIMGRDTASKTFALDKFSQSYPASGTTAKPDSVKVSDLKSNPVLVTKPASSDSEPVARSINPGEVRSKRTRE
jgi:hypothetical protein